MALLQRFRRSDQALGVLVMTGGLELAPQGELVAAAVQHRNEVLGAHFPLEGLSGEISYGTGVAEADIEGLTGHTEAFLSSGLTPSIQGYINDGLHVHTAGEILAAADGNMPPPPVIVGEPPKFTPDGMIFDPKDLPPMPEFPPNVPPRERPKPIEQTVPGGVTTVAGTSTPPSGAVVDGIYRVTRYTQGG